LWDHNNSLILNRKLVQQDFHFLFGFIQSLLNLVKFSLNYFNFINFQNKHNLLMHYFNYFMIIYLINLIFINKLIIIVNLNYIDLNNS
jgi:hypothetical protein